MRHKCSELSLYFPQPMRAATLGSQLPGASAIFQSPQPMRAATTLKALRAAPAPSLQSPQPMRAATFYRRNYWSFCIISIPAAHAGCDNISLSCSLIELNFNPRSPCGLRLADLYTPSTPLRISIPAAHAGCDIPDISCPHER